MKHWFVDPDSIVKQIWGKADTVLFIFAGAAAEFALNKAVDWLYFTGRLPADPLGRLFSTVTYARKIIFSEQEDALNAIDQIIFIHKSVEQNRGAQIPDWAYRDVLFLLIDYSIRSFELLERKLTNVEKDEVFEVFFRVGERMNLKNLPLNYTEWLKTRDEHLQQNLALSTYTVDLYQRYKKHLGAFRFLILKQVQLNLVPGRVKQLLPVNKTSWIKPILLFYKLIKKLKMESLVKNILLPVAYKAQISALDINH
jgi:ER-bound oxygenase mpaB/B'/Rubber oxygenase, catalytic domain